MAFAESLRKCMKDDRGHEVHRDHERLQTGLKSRNLESKRASRHSSKREEYIKIERNVVKTISWFLDCEVDPTISPYSIQNLCSFLYQRYNLKPGTWFKPSAVLGAIQAMHDKYKQHTIPNLEIEIFQEGTVYISQILKKVVSTSINNSSSNLDLEKAFEVIEEEEDLSFDFEDAHIKEHINKSLTQSQNCEASITEEGFDIEKLLSMKWHSSLVLFVMTKIGLDKPNPEYLPFIKELLTYPESIGLIGKTL